MSQKPMDRRTFSLAAAASLAALSLPRVAFASATTDGAQKAMVKEAIMHDADSIHHECALSAKPDRVFEALLDATQFSKMTGDRAEIDRAAGGAFSLFGGRIRGRNVSILANRRIVQAWRS